MQRPSDYYIRGLLFRQFVLFNPNIDIDKIHFLERKMRRLYKYYIFSLYLRRRARHNHNNNPNSKLTR